MRRKDALRCHCQTCNAGWRIHGLRSHAPHRKQSDFSRRTVRRLWQAYLSAEDWEAPYPIHSAGYTD